MKFAKYPHLAAAVTSIGFADDSQREGKDDDEEGPFVDEYVLDHDVTRCLIPRLHNLRELVLIGFREWDHPNQGTISMMKGLRSLKLLQMHLESDNLLDLVDSMPHLRSLTLDKFYLQRESHSDLESLRHSGELLIIPERGLFGTRPYRLQTLTLDHVHHQADIIMWLLGPRFDLSSVHAADLSWYRPSLQCPDQYYGLCPASHSTYGLNPSDDSDRAKEPQFPPLHRLLRSIGPHVLDLRLTLDHDPDILVESVRASVQLSVVLIFTKSHSNSSSIPLQNTMVSPFLPRYLFGR